MAPVKPSTVPRLELMAAHLLARLVTVVLRDLQLAPEDVYAWTDSSIVLAWLRGSSTRLKVFAANGVRAIQERVPGTRWRHVRTDDNPADLASRGMSPSNLIQSTTWWKGTPWLHTAWPPPIPNNSLPKEVPEIRKTVSVHAAASSAPWTFLTKYSSFNRLNRILAWMQRFTHNLRAAPDHRILDQVLLPEETQEAKLVLLRLSQRDTYADILDHVKDGIIQSVPASLKKFDVTLGDDGLILIQGSLRDTSSPQQPRSLILLNTDSTLCQLLLDTLHIAHKHTGTSILLSIVAETYLIPALRSHLKSLSRNCVVCRKLHALSGTPKMGMLPSAPTTPSPPFYVTGVDFAVPFLVHRGNPHKPTRVKVYASIFVCFATKAVHIELCSDLTADAFIAAFNRFCARRGVPLSLHSDNGTNFVGTKAEFDEVQHLLHHPDTHQALSHLATTSNMTWKFIPPRAPHFGGLWEAAVKAMKSTLRKLISLRPLSYEELNTLLIETKAILNSRPLAPMSSTDPDQGLAITAGHFLIGRPLKSPPPSRVKSDTNITSLRRWNLVQRLRQELWVTWKARYLQSLNARAKWHLQHRDYQVGDVVLIKDDTLAGRNWPLGRITAVYKGDNNVTRVVNVFTRGKTFKRSTNRLVLLIEDPADSSPPEDVRDYAPQLEKDAA